MCCQEELVLRTRRAIDALSYTRPATLSLKKLESAARWRLHLGGLVAARLGAGNGYTACPARSRGSLLPPRLVRITAARARE